MRRPTPLLLLALFLVLGVLAGPATGQAPSDVACSQFEVGSPRWQRCIEEEATSGVQAPAGAACSEFPVGSERWRECIEDAATGGGLMPWIIVIPLGVMVLGMAFMFSRQFSSRRSARYSTSTVGRYAGNWLIFMSLIEGSAGIGSLIAEQRAAGERGGFFIAGTVLIGVAIVMLVIGLAVRARAMRTQRIEEQGVPGQARVLSVTQTGVYVNENPQVEFELEVNTAGRSPYRVTHRQVVPLIMLGRLGSGMPLPVQVDPENPERIVIDWSAAPVGVQAPAFGGPGAPAGTGTASTLGTLASSTAPGGPEWQQAVDMLRARGISIPGLTDAPAPQGMSPPSPAPTGAAGAPPSVSVGSPFATGPSAPAGAVDARATIRAVQDTGAQVPGGKVVVLDLSVNVPGRPAQDVKHPATVPEFRVPQLFPGKTLSVKVDPTNLGQLFIDWDGV